MSRPERTATRRGAGVPPGSAAPVGSETTARLRRILGELGAAKGDLMEATAALRAVDTRVRLWDLGEPFLARRSHALRTGATVRFGAALDRLHALLQRLPDESLGTPAGAIPRRARNRRLLLAIRGQLRYLQRAFDGGSLLLARALASFSSTGL